MSISSQQRQMAASMNMGVFSKASELKKRLWFVLGALIVYRIGAYIPLPGIDPVTLKEIFRQNSGGILGMFNMFSGGALSRMTIFALNIMPYITASIIIQLMTVVSKHLETLKKEGESGRRKITQYTRYATVVLAAFQGFGIAVGLENMTAGGGSAVIDPGPMFRFTTTLTIVGGTLFLMWLGEQITARGVGNGISLIIFAGIVAELPAALAQTFEMGRSGALSTPLILGIFLGAIALIFLIVYMERAQRRLIIQYPKRQVGRKMYGGDSTHLPMKLNTAGVIPPIFAGSILLFPLTIAGFNAQGGPQWLSTVTTYLSPGQPVYLALYITVIVFFCFFYTAIQFNPEEAAENLRKNGGFIPGIRPGKPTAQYMDYVLTRITVVGAAYLALVCAVPELLRANYAIPFYLGGTSLLIVVNVVMDTMAQIQSHLFAHQYEGLIKKAKLKRR